MQGFEEKKNEKELSTNRTRARDIPEAYSYRYTTEATPPVVQSAVFNSSYWEKTSRVQMQ